ncbi:MAG TPA: shikimate dehydrogenase [archaeon]|nr:shikimate dehydrogenase [archaeon]
MIDAKTQLFCLLGKPAKHSLSPMMHNAGFSAIGMNCIYLAFEPENLAGTVKGLRELDVGGFNVTMPFKTEIIPLLDKVDEMAKKIGAVNTVVNENGKLVGYNTDGVGAVAALKKVTPLAGKKILLLGAGGAGKAIAHYLAKEKVQLTIADKTKSKAEELAKAVGSQAALSDGIKSLEGFDIVINASPAGMKPDVQGTPVPVSLLHKNLVVFDIVYEPLETKFLREARLKGCKTINGVEMLLEQGFAAFELFAQRRAPQEKMREALMNGIGR